MRWDEWRFSAALAWRDTFVRWGNVVSCIFLLITSLYLLWRLIPEGARMGTLALHYTMYLGIDDVRAWPWVFALPALMLILLTMNAAVAAGVYRGDALAARTMTAVSCALTILWSIGSFFLVRINL